MKLRLLPVVSLAVAAALLAAGCSANRVERPPAHPATSTPSGGATTSDSDDAAVATPTEAAGLLEAELLSALLTTEDLGDGWTRVNLDSTTKGSLPSTTGEAGYCGQAAAEVEALDGYIAAAWTAYERTESGIEARQQLVSYTEEDATPAFARFAEFLRSCKEWTQAGPSGSTWKWTVREVKAGTIAHESVYVQIELGEGETPAGQARMVVWRRGPVLSIVTLVNAPGGDTAAFPESVLTLLQNRLRFAVNLNQ